MDDIGTAAELARTGDTGCDLRAQLANYAR
jgi:hypothetical protein